MNRIPFLILSAAAVLLSACAEKPPEINTYTEVIQMPPKKAAAPASPHGAGGMPGIPSDMQVESDFDWTLPSGWTNGENRPGRLATLMVEDASCSISSLGGGGSVEANVRRWAGQLGLSADAQVGTRDLPSEVGTWNLIDFTAASRAAGSDQSMVAAILAQPSGRTIFVKLSGATELLSAQRENVSALCSSFRPKAGN